MALDETLWQFPVDYMLKVIGRSDVDMVSLVSRIIARHVDAQHFHGIKSRPSRNGSYIAVSAMLYLTHKGQVEGIYRDLSLQQDVLWSL
jgi:hypothetical protein